MKVQHNVVFYGRVLQNFLPTKYNWELGILRKNLLMNEWIKVLKNPFGYVNKLHTRKKSERSSDIVSKE
jgi:hypothetical protein